MSDIQLTITKLRADIDRLRSQINCAKLDDADGSRAYGIALLRTALAIKWEQLEVATQEAQS